MIFLKEILNSDLQNSMLLIANRYRFQFIGLINTTRNYHYGLHLADIFENTLDVQKKNLKAAEIESVHLLVHHLRLNCLDKLDRWNSYISYYDKLSSIEPMPKRMEILLSLQRNRRDVIKRKIEKSTTSNKLGNLMHKPQSELSDKEIEERAKSLIEWVTNFDKKHRRFR